METDQKFEAYKMQLENFKEELIAHLQDPHQTPAM